MGEKVSVSSDTSVPAASGSDPAQHIDLFDDLENSTSPGNILTDLQGVGNLLVDAIIEITEIAEALHYTISRLSMPLGRQQSARTTGITGMVYRKIRSVAGLMGTGMNYLLDRFSLKFGLRAPSARHDTVLAVLNGVLGHHLTVQQNPLSISMHVRQAGEPLNRDHFFEAVQESNARLAIMVHGLGMNDMRWNRKGHDHGIALARDLGVAPIYLRYNTGLHISENGRQFSDLLESIMDASPQPTTLYILAYSMGGLVSRSAYYYGETYGYTWPRHLEKLVFLGTPHHGSALEQGGNRIETALGISPYSAPFSRLGRIRSCGITDMRYGSIVEDDWRGTDRFVSAPDNRTPVPLPEGVQCYSAAATLSGRPNRLGDEFIGDGLVPLSSALGRHEDPEFNLAFPDSHQWIGRNMGHLTLLNHPDVYDVIKEWIGSA